MQTQTKRVFRKSAMWLRQAAAQSGCGEDGKGTDWWPPQWALGSCVFSLPYFLVLEDPAVRAKQTHTR